jgi:hypothetical protein
VAQQVVEARTVAARDAHADADRAGPALARRVLVHRRVEPLGHACRVHVVGIGEQEGELVASDACSGIDGAHLGAQQPCDLDERPVTSLVAKLVVDLLEAIEVGDEQRERASSALVLRQLAGVGRREPTAIGESGEGIGAGVSAEL